MEILKNRRKNIKDIHLIKDFKSRQIVESSESESGELEPVISEESDLVEVRILASFNSSISLSTIGKLENIGGDGIIERVLEKDSMENNELFHHLIVKSHERSFT